MILSLIVPVPGARLTHRPVAAIEVAHGIYFFAVRIFKFDFLATVAQNTCPCTQHCGDVRMLIAEYIRIGSDNHVRSRREIESGKRKPHTFL